MKHTRILLIFLSAPSLAFFAHPSPPLLAYGQRLPCAMRVCMVSVCVLARWVCACAAVAWRLMTVKHTGHRRLSAHVQGGDPLYVFVSACCMLARVWRHVLLHTLAKGMLCITHASACLLC